MINLEEVVPKRDQNPEVLKKLRKAKQFLIKDKNFTIVVIQSNGYLAAGASKRNPTDLSNGQIGERIAAIRAYRWWVKHVI